MTEKPTDFSWAARSILTYLRPGWREWPDRQVEEITAGVEAIVRNEAVAPAVRELVQAIDALAAAYKHPTQPPVGACWAAVIDAANRCRHLLEAE